MSDVIINAIINLEEKNFPFYDINSIEIVKVSMTDKGEMISYRVEVSSRINPIWKLTQPTREVNMSKLLTEIRDIKIKDILED
jgi:hypothetical protein